MYSRVNFSQEMRPSLEFGVGGTGIGRGGMAGKRIWEVKTAGPKVVDWGFWAEGDVDEGPGMKVGVPGFGIKVLDKGWGTKAGNGGPGFVPQIQTLLFFYHKP